MPYFIMFSKYLTQIRKLHVLKDEGSGVSISWGKTFQLAFEIHLKITVRRHNLKSKTNFKVKKCHKQPVLLQGEELKDAKNYL